LIRVCLSPKFSSQARNTTRMSLTKARVRINMLMMSLINRIVRLKSLTSIRKMMLASRNLIMNKMNLMNIDFKVINL